MILEITPAARADLLEQFRHYHFDLDLPEVAQRWLAGVEAAFDRILGMPKIGSPQEVSNPAFPGLRAWPVPSFEDPVSYTHLDVYKRQTVPRDASVIRAPEPREAMSENIR